MDGKLTAGLAVVGAAVALLGQSELAQRIVGSVIWLAIGAACLYDFVNVSRAVESVNGSIGVAASVGSGLWFSCVGAVVLLAAAVMSFLDRI